MSANSSYQNKNTPALQASSFSSIILERGLELPMRVLLPMCLRRTCELRLRLHLRHTCEPGLRFSNPPLLRCVSSVHIQGYESKF